jgi:hypothetical protein
MSARSRKPDPGAMPASEYDEYVETRILALPRKRDPDTSLLDGLILGALTGAALVLAFTPLVRDQVRRLARQLGIDSNAPAGPTPTELRDEVLTRVAPPPDPLSGSPVPPAAPEPPAAS